MSVQSFKKDPSAVLDYGFDWSDYLITGETITASTWTVPTGLVEDSNEIADTSTKVWISSGTLGEQYTVANKITTTDGRIDERSLTIIVEDR